MNTTMKSAVELYLQGAVTDDIHLDAVDGTDNTYVINAPIFFRDGDSLVVYLVRTHSDGIYTITDKGHAMFHIGTRSDNPVIEDSLLERYDMVYKDGSLIKTDVKALDICMAVLEYIQGITALETYNKLLLSSNKPATKTKN